MQTWVHTTALVISKDFLLVSEMKIFQYMRIHRKYVPDEIINAYELTDSSIQGPFILRYKGMYGLKRSRDVLAYDQLKTHLSQYGLCARLFPPGLWKPGLRQTTFTLAVGTESIFLQRRFQSSLLGSGQQICSYKDWTGTSFILDLPWRNYDAGFIDISLPTYVTKSSCQIPP
jgi:hypothetical protein